MIALAAGLDHTGEQCDRARALSGSGAMADAPGDDPMPECALSGIVRQWQLRMIERHPEGLEVVEQLAGERARLLMASIGLRKTQPPQGVELFGVLLAQGR